MMLCGLSACIHAVGYCVLFSTQDYCVLGAVCDVMDLLASHQNGHVHTVDSVLSLSLLVCLFCTSVQYFVFLF